MFRSDITNKVPVNTIALELGVGEGKFTEQLILQHKFLHVYSIDAWNRNESEGKESEGNASDREYKKALIRLDIYKDRNSIIRMSFDSAIEIFPNHYFDFIHIDAGENENKIEVMESWLLKLKENGMISGMGYHPDCPETVEAVDTFVRNHGFVLHVHDYQDKDDDYSKYPCWYIERSDRGTRTERSDRGTRTERSEAERSEAEEEFSFHPMMNLH